MYRREFLEHSLIVGAAFLVGSIGLSAIVSAQESPESERVDPQSRNLLFGDARYGCASAGGVITSHRQLPPQLHSIL